MSTTDDFEGGVEYEEGDINQVPGASAGFDDEDEFDDEELDDEELDDEELDDEELDDEFDEGDDEGEGNRADQAGGTNSSAVLGYLARALASDPDAVVVRSESHRNGVRLRLHVAPEDMGRVIGRRGRTAQALRTLVGVAGAREGVPASVDIVDD